MEYIYTCIQEKILATLIPLSFLAVSYPSSLLITLKSFEMSLLNTQDLT